MGDTLGWQRHQALALAPLLLPHAAARPPGRAPPFRGLPDASQLQILTDVAIPVSIEDREQLIKAANTSLSSKVGGGAPCSVGCGQGGRCAAGQLVPACSCVMGANRLGTCTAWHA